MSAKIFNLFGNNKKYPSFFRINLTKAFTILIIKRIEEGYYFFKKVCLSEEKIVLLRPNYITEVENLINCLNMPVKIRLQRVGAKKQPHYHIVVADSKSPRDGRIIERIGSFDPRADKIILDQDKVQTWIKNGAQPTDTVKALIKKA